MLLLKISRPHGHLKSFNRLLRGLCCCALIWGLFSLSGCYYLHTAYHQVSLLGQRTPADEILEDESVSTEDKAKIRLALKARDFAEQELGLSANGNYSSVVRLDRPSLSYVVSAAEKWELKPWNWSFPIVGTVPYKGYFREDMAKAEALDLQSQGLDTYVRGVSAFSLLGWFKDPLYSSMLRMKDTDLVNTIIHETVHATIYISSNADFNERLAVFMGNWGTELFYIKQEGPNSPSVQKIRDENLDDKDFALFITSELNLLDEWYKTKPEQNESLRLGRIKEIQSRFQTLLAPKLRTYSYQKFPELELNNARLLVYRTYLQDLSKFERLAKAMNWDYRKFLEQIKTLKDSTKPEEDLTGLGDH